MMRFDKFVIEAIALLLATPFVLHLLLPGKKSPDLRGHRMGLIILLSMIIYSLGMNMIFGDFHKSLGYIIMILIGAAVSSVFYFLLPGKRTSVVRTIIITLLSGIVCASFPFISSSLGVRMWAHLIAAILFLGGAYIALITVLLYTLIIDRNKKTSSPQPAPTLATSQQTTRHKNVLYLVFIMILFGGVIVKVIHDYFILFLGLTLGLVLAYFAQKKWKEKKSKNAGKDTR